MIDTVGLIAYSSVLAVLGVFAITQGHHTAGAIYFLGSGLCMGVNALRDTIGMRRK